ncbi:MAG: hypothetical protein J5814_08375, partial [Bacteroidaceae bacterium]|nr:hypothetical protein [Bacteroidaceae bacterium]
PAGEGDFESTVRIFYPPPCSDCSGNLPGAHADGSFLVLLVCMEIVSKIVLSHREIVCSSQKRVQR